MPEYSVVIPTFNRMDVLPEVLAALEAQEEAPSFEVVVIDDGSSDGTAEWLAGCRWRIPVEAVSQPNRGPAEARNRGVQLASGGRVAFLGDDTVPSRGWLAAHYRAVQARSDRDRVAVLGYTGWHSRMRLMPSWSARTTVCLSSHSSMSFGTTCVCRSATSAWTAASIRSAPAP